MNRDLEWSRIKGLPNRIVDHNRHMKLARDSYETL